MTDRAAPLVNRGPEALQCLLLRDPEGVAQNLNLLTRTELTDLAAAADQIARMARAVIADTWPGHVSARALEPPHCPGCGIRHDPPLHYDAPKEG